MKQWMTLAALFIFSVSTFACTTFCINQDGHIVFGRNYDWVTGAGCVNTNQRGLFKTSMKVRDGEPITWVSKYGSLTFNQYGKEFPTGGMNEKGLVVELMWLDETSYPAKDNRPALTVLQWIQYQLDNAATAAEVIESDQKIRITGTGTPLHYLVADASGNVASIEFLKGKMVVHTGKQLIFPVLTNNSYETSSQTATTFLKEKKEIRLSDNSLERYVKACDMVSHVNLKENKIPLSDYAFSILDKVSQGSFTQWSIVYDISNKQIHFKTNNYPDVKTISFSGFDFSCKAVPEIYDMNQQGKGEITTAFIASNREIKRRVIEQAVTESSSRVHISHETQEALLNYSDTINCK